MEPRSRFSAKRIFASLRVAAFLPLSRRILDRRLIAALEVQAQLHLSCGCYAPSNLS